MTGGSRQRGHHTVTHLSHRGPAWGAAHPGGAWAKPFPGQGASDLLHARGTTARGGNVLILTTLLPNTEVNMQMPHHRASEKDKTGNAFECSFTCQ